MLRIVKNTAAVLFGVVALTGTVEKAKAYDPALNAKVVAFAQAHLGQQVGDGQCWALADQALAAAGAHRPGQGGWGVYTFGESYRAWGYIYWRHRVGWMTYRIKPGDVIQFEGVKFVYPDGSWNDFPHHTAIVLSVSGTKIGLIQQNSDGVMKVSTGTIDLAMKKSGTMTFFHPVAQ